MPGKRKPDQTQITISLPRHLVDRIDACAKVARRTRSNWIVNEIDARCDYYEARAELDRAGASAPRFPTTAAAVVSTPTVNEEPTPRVVSGNSTPQPSAAPTSKPTRAAIRKMVKREKDQSA